MSRRSEEDLKWMEKCKSFDIVYRDRSRLWLEAGG